MPKSFCRTPGMQCYCTSSVIFRIQCRFFVRDSVTCRQCTWHVAHSPSSLSGAPHARLARSWCRWHPGPPAPACLAAAEPRSGRHGATLQHSTVGHRPNQMVAPCGHLLASARMQHRRRGLARAERVLCRRRAARPFHRGQVVTPLPC